MAPQLIFSAWAQIVLTFIYIPKKGQKKVALKMAKKIKTRKVIVDGFPKCGYRRLVGVDVSHVVSFTTLITRHNCDDKIGVQKIAF